MHAGLRAEDHQRLAETNLIAEAEFLAALDFQAVNVSAVGRAEIFEHPFAVVGFELAMAAGDGVVGNRNLATLTPECRGGVGEFIATAFIGAL